MKTAASMRREATTGHSFDPLGRIGIAGRLAVVLFGLVILPMIAALVLLEADLVPDPAAMLGMALAVSLGLLAPVSRLGASFVVLRDLRRLNEFCSQIRRGSYGTRLPVGLERDDEHEMLRLKRNMNWMAHHIQAQTRSLRERLDESDLRKRFYEEMSYRDPLTGLYNRRYFEQFMSNLLRTPCRGRGMFLALVDCDCFKQVNDTRGHQAGDDVLACLARTIRESVREGSDLGFRFGGDEFGVLFRDICLSDCCAVCDRIRARFASSNGCGCTVSVGLKAWTPEMGPDVSALLQACDACLYLAKDRGGNQVASVTPPQPSAAKASASHLCRPL